jgi:hypothetical protein
VADGVDASVEAVETVSDRAIVDLIGSHPQLEQLPASNDPMLRFSQHRDPTFDRRTFDGYMPY